jgi:transmembrane sensor
MDHKFKNKMDSFPIERIIASFEGRLSDGEQKELELWLSESVENQNKYDELRKVVKLSDQVKVDFQPDECKALESVNRKLRFRRIVIWSQRMAASFVFVFILTRVILFVLPDTNLLEVNSIGQQVIYLSDSSKVTLAANSQLKYQKQFAGNERDVILHGKAYFEITPNKQHPFVVRTTNTKIKVLGTKFMVDAHHPRLEIVVVDEGRVEFSSVKSDKNKVQELTANEIGVWHANNDSITEQLNTDTNLNAGFSRRLTFKEAPLETVIRDFERFYQVKIELSDKRLETRKYTGSFSNQEADKALRILCNSLSLILEQKEAIYIIKP